MKFFLLLVLSCNLLIDDDIEVERVGDCAIEVERAGDRTIEKKGIDYTLCSSILLGDGLHNLGDGIFVGTAFLLCSNKVAYSIALSTVLHELPQELADFFLLTRHAGLSICTALALNFLSGITVVIGGLLVLFSEPSMPSVGIILAVAGGVYVYVATTEVHPKINEAIETKAHHLLGSLGFVLGDTLIGLVLIDHQHCDV